VSPSGALVLRGSTSIESAPFRAGVTFEAGGASVIDFQTDVDFSDGIKMCLQMGRPEFAYRWGAEDTEMQGNSRDITHNSCLIEESLVRSSGGMVLMVDFSAGIKMCLQMGRPEFAYRWGGRRGGISMWGVWVIIVSISKCIMTILDHFGQMESGSWYFKFNLVVWAFVWK
jgi:hypothetical protein